MGLLALPFTTLATTVAGSFGVELSASAASIIGGVGALGVSVGLSLVSAALMPQPTTDPANGQIETQQSIPTRKFVYGRREISAPKGFWKSDLRGQAPNLIKILLVHDGELDAFETTWGDDRICQIDGNGFVDNGPFFQAGEARLQLAYHMGTANQLVDSLMQFYFPTTWTDSHRLRGVAYVVVNAKGVDSENYLQTYPQGEPQFKFTIRGRKLWDPRDPDSSADVPATWLWSDNAALAILDWLAMHPKGYKIDRTRLDIDSFIAMADLCDELVPLKDGGSELRYRVAEEVDLHTPRTDVLARLRAACASTLYKTGEGKWALRGGKWTDPTVLVDSARGHIIDSDITDGPDALKRYNVLEIRYLQPDNHYVANDAKRWENEHDTDFIAGIERTSGVDFTQVPSHGQARRLAKIMTAYENPTWMVSASLNFYGLHLVGEENLNLNTAEPDEDGSDLNGPYWLEPGLMLLENGAVVTINARSADPSAFDWNALTEEGDSPSILPPSGAEDDYTPGTPPDVPDDFDITAGVRSVVASWTRENSGPTQDQWIFRVWRGLTTDFDDAYEISGPRYPNGTSTERGPEAMTFYYPALGGVAYRYWLTVENQVGDRATPVGPVTATATSTGEWFIEDDFGNLLMDDDGDSLTLPV